MLVVVGAERRFGPVRSGGGGGHGGGQPPPDFGRCERRGCIGALFEAEPEGGGPIAVGEQFLAAPFDTLAGKLPDLLVETPRVVAQPL